ncbi:MAG: sn-glycerol-3-phosphate ABC transporter ATP-binding protein UgpC [Pelagibacteraceae bacterium]|jgi:sn-glycerol 3-phosphate transport system ATP-binding protein|nr:sn-glycerol-3-phosphate ABC transporter ATP-binding protein UgpC [Pelagibacteraceae bacterium]MBO6470111.1 sn-glycerol-3-phosphate ABC transporter ATP-binding protein UgpC [Pelagibacteraceae bacterium]MBO6471606.1 sn-glycerol-3-phosphate ABC transporter ATP-binding protein UgpC [Pelagibacteraceae bacterium]HJL58633.1 sn-glycerol-3-phosphate ABC transporter ATP-binding protein UgpC [Alphaproteobacteria bacterium]
MSFLELKNITKVYPNGTKAINETSLNIEYGEFMVFVGPSGCGKSTLLRMIAGLEDITEGEIDLDGKTINKIDPSERDVAMVFQNYALYPHMNVYKNLSYGLKNRGESKENIDNKVKEVAELLEIKEYLQRKPAQLSGGQRQRVAMGRAIVRNPKVFLFDEPLSNLDAKLRGQVRIEIKKLQQSMNVTSVFVTHDQVEAMTLGDRLAVINNGVIEQLGTPIEVYEKPASKFVGEFIGSPQMNFVNGAINNNNFESSSFKLNKDLNIDNASVVLGFRAEDLNLKEEGEISLTIDIIEKLGSDSIIYGRDKDGQSICYKESGNTKLEVGEIINISLDVDAVHIFDEKTGKRLN